MPVHKCGHRRRPHLGWRASADLAVRARGEAPGSGAPRLILIRRVRGLPPGTPAHRCPRRTSPPSTKRSVIGMSGKRAGGSASANTGRRRAAGCSSCITSPACRVFADARAVPPAGGPGPRLPVAARQPGPTGRESCLPSAGPAAAITCRSDGAATPPGYVALPRGTQGFAGSSPGDIARHVYLLPEVIAATGQTVQAIPRGRWLAGRVNAGQGAGIRGHAPRPFGSMVC